MATDSISQCSFGNPEAAGETGTDGGFGNSGFPRGAVDRQIRFACFCKDFDRVMSLHLNQDYGRLVATLGRHLRVDPVSIVLVNRDGVAMVFETLNELDAGIDSIGILIEEDGSRNSYNFKRGEVVDLDAEEVPAGMDESPTR